MKITERTIINEVIKVFRRANVTRMSCQVKGVPDLLIAWEGQPVFLEIKTENVKLSKLQKRFLQKHGGAVYQFGKTYSYTSFFPQQDYLPFQSRFDGLLSEVDGNLKTRLAKSKKWRAV